MLVYIVVIAWRVAFSKDWKRKSWQIIVMSQSLFYSFQNAIHNLFLKEFHCMP